MDKIKHNAVIVVFVKHGIAPMEIHNETVTVLGHAVVLKIVACK